jgi:hypothetical protein
MATDAAPIQPLANGLLMIVGGVPIMSGIGFQSAVARGASPVGDFIIQLEIGNLALDPVSTGLPGDIGIDPRFGRIRMTARGLGTPPAATLAQLAASYIVSPVPGMGAQQIQITTRLANGAFIDPVAPDAAGLEIILFRGNPTSPDFSQQFSGPAYQPVMVFP